MSKMGQRFKSRLIAFSAASGAGKSTIVRRLRQKYPEMVVSVSATTRPIRPREKDGVDYYFLSVAEFNARISASEFIEHEEVHGNFYGTLKSEVVSRVENGNIVLFDIDVKGALSIKNHFPESILIFIKAPSQEALVNRLKARKSETDESIRKRLERLPFEEAESVKFDYVVVNEDLDQTIAEIEKLIIEG